MKMEIIYLMQTHHTSMWSIIRIMPMDGGTTSDLSTGKVSGETCRQLYHITQEEVNTWAKQNK
ncbi:hypothetical protein [Bacteroides thetaiotaomicron]|uniref:hypothetical protein n=1 Tax=Bacteroides thetaiotaomicron TaxID=818 RepID=UPI00286E3E84|nr:hypothetical protein [Bacteroides thetaiotaomicron]MCS2264251.1 hypothetical protein [Bacteroides thetaiotaomicron]